MDTSTDNLQSVGLEARHMLILFGSETGNAHDIAEELGRMAERLHFDTLVTEMNDIELKDLIRFTLVIFVTSTTGQGDMPQNITRFWKSLLRKKLPQDCLSKLRFTLFGLGDSSYSKYNWAARKIQKRVLQLGATEFFPSGEGDERHDDGIDSIYLPWSKDLRDYLLASYPLPPSTEPIPDDTPLPPKYILRLVPNMFAASAVRPLTEQERADPDLHWEVIKNKTAAISHIERPKTRDEQVDTDWYRLTGAGCGVEILARRDDTSSRLVLGQIPVDFLDKDNILKDAPEKYLLRPSSPQPLGTPPGRMLPIPGCVPAFVEKNTRVTPPDHWQDVRKVILIIPTGDQPGIPKVLPGSTVTIYPKNFPDDVQSLITRMGWEEYADKVVEWGYHGHPGKLQIDSPPYKLYASPDSTLRDLLIHNFDITAVPKRSFIQSLVYFTDDDREKERLHELTIPNNTMEFYDYTSRPRRTILEVLQDFPSVKIPFYQIPSHFPLIRGREFSVANGGVLIEDAKAENLRLELLIGIVQYKTIIRKPRQGLCSRYVKTLAAGSEIGVTLRKGYNPPCEEIHTQRPLIAIATGTGIAPIRSLIWERLMYGNVGHTVLFFGCRNREKDFYYSDEWEVLKKEFKFDVEPAFSRDPEAQDPLITDPYKAQYINGVLDHKDQSKTVLMAYDYDRGRMYVQHLIRKNAALVCQLIREKAILALCGSSGRMPKSVRQAILDAIMTDGELAKNYEEAEKLLNGLTFWQEVW